MRHLAIVTEKDIAKIRFDLERVRELYPRVREARAARAAAIQEYRRHRGSHAMAAEAE